MRKSLLMDRVFNRPLLVNGTKANLFAPFLAQEILGQNTVVIPFNAGGDFAAPPPPSRHAGKLGTGISPETAEHRNDELVPRTRNGVALISVEGTLVNKGGWIGMDSGETSYHGLMRQIAEVRDDETVKAVVFEVDSYGGEVAGCADCGAAIADLSAEKPTIAILTDHAYSAAYWLASQCRQIILPAAGGAGSIGVISLHFNYEEAMKKAGVAVTVLADGDHKADGHPYAALPDAVREEILAEFAIVREQFAEAVASGRGKRLDRNAALATEARCFMGQAAVDAGIADAVARPSEAFEGFVRQF